MNEVLVVQSLESLVVSGTDEILVPGPSSPQVLLVSDAGPQGIQGPAAPVPGTDKQIVFNDGGALGGNSGFTWDKVGNTLTVVKAAISATGETVVLTNKSTQTVGNQTNFSFVGPKLGGGTISLTFDASGYLGTDYPYMRFLIGGASPAAVTSGGLQVRSISSLGFSGDGNSGGTMDTTLSRDAAGVLAQRNGLNPQAFRLYNTYTDASNYERLKIVWESNQINILAESAGTGGNRQMSIGTTSANAQLYFVQGNVCRWYVGGSGHFLAGANNAYDIGANGGRPRSGYFGTSLTAPVVRVSSSVGVSPYLTFTELTVQDWSIGMKAGTGKLSFSQGNALTGTDVLTLLSSGTGATTTLTGPGTTNVTSLVVNNMGAGTGGVQFNWASGGWMVLDDFGGKAQIRIINHTGLNFTAAGTGDANGIFGFDADPNAQVAGGPLIAFKNNGARKAEIGTDGSFKVYNTFTDASNYQRLALKTSATQVELAAESAGTGAANIDVVLTPKGTGVVKAPVVRTTALTVATLTAPATAGAGARAFVADATLAAAGNFGAAVVGGGANKVPVWCDGAGWFIG